MTKKNKPKTKRQLQVGEEIRRQIARHINTLLENNIDGDFLTFMKADVSPDFRYCKVFYRCKVANKEVYQQQLDLVSNELANFVYKQIKLRIRPELRFIFDDTITAIEDIERVINNNKQYID